MRKTYQKKHLKLLDQATHILDNNLLCLLVYPNETVVCKIIGIQNFMVFVVFFSRFGKYSGYGITDIRLLEDIEFDSDYVRIINQLIIRNNEQYEKLSFESDYIQNLIKHAQSLQKPVWVYFYAMRHKLLKREGYGPTQVYGFIKSITEENLVISKLSDGEILGECNIFLDEIFEVVFDSDSSKEQELLYKLNTEMKHEKENRK